MTRKFYLEQETGAARRLQTRSGFEFWIPRSVCKSTLKFPPNREGRVVVEIDIEDWWWVKNEMDVKMDTFRQKDLFK